MFLGNMTQINVVAGLIAGSAGVIGHNFPVWLKFKGGKGIVCLAVMILMTDWRSFFILFFDCNIEKYIENISIILYSRNIS